MSTITTPSASQLDLAVPLSGEKEPLFAGLTASAWVKILIVTGVLVALFRFSLARLWLKTNPFSGDANWGHTTIIPLIGLYYLYLNRDRLLAAKVTPILFERLTRTRLIVAGVAIAGGALSYFAGGAILAAILGPNDNRASFANILGIASMAWGVLMLLLGWGVGNIVFGLLTFASGIYPAQNDWLTDYGMVHTIFGTVLTICGWEVMRVAWFPIAFLICGIPWPGLVYAWIAGPLQRLAAAVAEKTLDVTGIDSVRSGTKIFFRGADGLWESLNVEEACAGMRSLMTFIAVGAAVAFLSGRALWQKVIITLSAIPIAIFCNVMRVTGQAYLHRFAGREWSQGFAHGFVGLVMLMPAFFLILLVAWLIDHLFIEEVDDKEKFKATAARSAAGAGQKTTIVVPTKPRAAAVAKTQAAPAAVMPARVPPRQNLTGKSAPPGDDRSVEGA